MIEDMFVTVPKLVLLSFVCNTVSSSALNQYTSTGFEMKLPEIWKRNYLWVFLWLEMIVHDATCWSTNSTMWLSSCVHDVDGRVISILTSFKKGKNKVELWKTASRAYGKYWYISELSYISCASSWRWSFVIINWKYRVGISRSGYFCKFH